MGIMDKMMDMMPLGSRMVLPNMPDEKRIDFVMEMVTPLMEHGIVGTSEEE